MVNEKVKTRSRVEGSVVRVKVFNFAFSLE